MPFRYLAGITTAGAADEIVDWFATFEAWVTAQVGWTVENGAGTTNLVLRSIGEVGGLTMLYMHVWRDPGDPDQVKVEVRDDLAGTHETIEGGVLNGAGAQFPFWMSGDRDAIMFCFRGGAVYYSVYAGLVMPFALTVPDETYQMIATSTMVTGSILRNHTGIWDVDAGLYDNQIITVALDDVFDGSLVIGGTFFGRQDAIAGQLNHISGAIGNPASTVGSTMTSRAAGGTTTWIVLQDTGGRRYAMRTGGVYPTGTPDSPAFSHVSGVAANHAAFFAAIGAFCVANGWANLGDPGYWSDGIMCSSVGESGVEEIFIGYAINMASAPDGLYFYVADDAAGTHRVPVAGWKFLDAAEFPINYWLSGDANCCVLVYQVAAGYCMIWSGWLPPFAPGLLPPYAGAPLTPYQMITVSQGPGNVVRGLLRTHAGIWENLNVTYVHDGADCLNSNPNAFDGTTYLVWPFVAYMGDMLGQLPYVGFSSGGGIGNMDTITIGAQVYTVFFDHLGDNFCLRTV